MITTPGYYDLPLGAYLAGACPEPELSTEIIWTLFYETPKHARLKHPRMLGQKPDASPRADIGSAVHSLALGGAPIKYVGMVTKRSGKDAGKPFLATDWKTDDAKEAAELIRAEGSIPLLEHQRMQVELAGNSAKAAIAALGPGTFERSMFWQTEGVWSRGRADWLSDGAVEIDGRHFGFGIDLDLKTVTRAERRAWLRTNVLSESQKLDIQMGLRDLGHQALTGKPRGMVWLLQEIEAPYDCSFIVVSQAMLQQAHMKVNHAAKLWRRALDTDTWPGYGNSVFEAEPRPYAEMDIQSRIGAA